jgi:hypothetical protein
MVHCGHLGLVEGLAAILKLKSTGFENIHLQAETCKLLCQHQPGDSSTDNTERALLRIRCFELIQIDVHAFLYACELLAVFSLVYTCRRSAKVGSSGQCLVEIAEKPTSQRANIRVHYAAFVHAVMILLRAHKDLDRFDLLFLRCKR